MHCFYIFILKITTSILIIIICFALDNVGMIKDLIWILIRTSLPSPHVFLFLSLFLGVFSNYCTMAGLQDLNNTCFLCQFFFFSFQESLRPIALDAHKPAAEVVVEDLENKVQDLNVVTSTSIASLSFVQFD